MLWIIPALPLLGFLLLISYGSRLSRRQTAAIGVGSVLLSACAGLYAGGQLLLHPSLVYEVTLWTWIDIGDFHPAIALRMDALAAVFVFVITLIGALIHLYSAEFMEKDPDYSRFFACMNLFVFAMLVLVLADNLLLLYLGWEGVGLCSYLLIGFWYENPANGHAARKAFTMTRIGDTALAIGLFCIYYACKSLNIVDISTAAPLIFQQNPQEATLIAFLLLGGALGKSAQLPLQTWLPDAMAGPSPVSALIHAATMVTAGVYLIARMYVFFELAPAVQGLIAVIGAITLLVAGLSALTQYDIKRVLAYSTISQIGYMFLALGVGAWTAAIFHFMVHAFFKALLFLGAGAIIESVNHEHSMFRMGGLRKKLPIIFWTFMVGTASLAAIPLVTAGFYSKDQILWYAWGARHGQAWLWSMAWVGAFITAAYSARMVLLVFWGPLKTEVTSRPRWSITFPLIALAVCSTWIGFVDLPHNFGHFTPFSDFLHHTLPLTELRADPTTEWMFQILATVATVGGLLLAYSYYYIHNKRLRHLANQPLFRRLHRLWLAGWGFDKLYQTFISRPFLWVTKANKADGVDQLYSAMANITTSLNQRMAALQSGSLRWYIMGMVLGAIILFGLQLLL